MMECRDLPDAASAGFRQACVCNMSFMSYWCCLKQVYGQLEEGRPVFGWVNCSA